MGRMTLPATIMPQDLFEQIIHELCGCWRPPISILLSPNSEVLSDLLLLERLARLRRHDIAKVTTLMTNAQFLNEATAEAILDAGILHPMPGFDGASKAVNGAHRVGCNYERVLENIRTFVKLRQQMSQHTRIIVKLVRTPRNEHEVVDARRLFGAFLDPELVCSVNVL